jgi:hypothetical protein
MTKTAATPVADARVHLGARHKRDKRCKIGVAGGGEFTTDQL